MIHILYIYIFHDTTIKYPMKSQSLWLRPTLDIMKAESAFLRSMKSENNQMKTWEGART